MNLYKALTCSKKLKLLKEVDIDIILYNSVLLRLSYGRQPLIKIRICTLEN